MTVWLPSLCSKLLYSIPQKERERKLERRQKKTDRKDADMF